LVVDEALLVTLSLLAMAPVIRYHIDGQEFYMMDFVNRWFYKKFR
jgi:hypothetical protein